MNSERDKYIISNITSIVSNILKDINSANDNGRIEHYEEIVGTKSDVATKKCSITYRDKDGLLCSFQFERKYFYNEEEEDNENGPQ